MTHGERAPGSLQEVNGVETSTNPLIGARGEPSTEPAEVADANERLGPRQAHGRWAGLAPSRTQWLVLVIGLMAVSNVGQWIALRDASNGPRITVVGVREMTQAYVQKISSPALSEQESLIRAQTFVAAAQDELHRLVPGRRLVLAKECVLAGEQDDITAALQQAVETKLGKDTTGLSNIVGPVQPGLGLRTTAAASRSPVSASSLLSPSSDLARAAER